MECAVQILYYMFAALALGGALGVALSRGGLNSVMAMLVSTLGMSGMLFMMKAFFIAFIMAMVYAGAVMALFVFVIMLVGEERENLSLRRRACAAGLWALLCAACFFFARAVPQIAEAKVASSDDLAGLNG
ncbi:MAG: NADH-quinone oxidoreductase subunit J, partial [Opitutales bacterium]|nr:NADH-quinone oxidoreductase subunit J [Opitutales bacterium]